VPYVGQNDIPLFDSAWLPLTFAQLFNSNRFTGTDRIGDANQVTLAVTSRFIDQESGTEKLRASMGQIYYFQNRQVQLEDKLLPPNLQAAQNRLGALSSTAHVSPIISELNYHIANNWYFLLNGGYDIQLGEIYSAGGNFQYVPASR
jgi:LPS-assembly protein